MAKKIMQDVVKKSRARAPRAEAETAVHHAVAEEMPSHRYIEDRLPEKATSRASEKKKEAAFDRSPIFEKMRLRNEERGSFSDEFESSRGRDAKRYLKYGGIAAIIVLGIGIFLYGVVAYSAHIKISLKNSEVPLNGQEFSAVGANPAATDVPFQIMTLSEEQHVGLTPTGEKQISTKAAGTITISNAYSAQSQILIKNTRFQTPDGKIYRIDKTVVVPGMNKQMPGTIDATVLADAPGPSYNISQATFVIPGFKGTPRYSKFTAKTKTAISGGSSGVQKVVSDNDIKQARANLTDALKTKLLTEAEAEHPKGTVLFDDAIYYTFTDATGNNTDAQGMVTFTLKGTLQAVIFDSAALGRQVAATMLGSSVGPNDEIDIDNIKDMKFSWVNPGSSAPAPDASVKFTLIGNAHVVWSVDSDALKTKLLGTKKSDYQSVLAQFPGIQKGSASIQPFWKTVFPENLDKIYIEMSVDAEK